MAHLVAFIFKYLRSRQGYGPKICLKTQITSQRSRRRNGRKTCPIPKLQKFHFPNMLGMRRKLIIKVDLNTADVILKIDCVGWVGPPCSLVQLVGRHNLIDQSDRSVRGILKFIYSTKPDLYKSKCTLPFFSKVTGKGEGVLALKFYV